MNVIDNPQRSRFELEEQGQTAFANYRLHDGLFVIPHVESPPALRGKGAADRLMRGIVEKARIDRFKVEPWCSYAIAWFQRHPDAKDVLAD